MGSEDFGRDLIPDEAMKALKELAGDSLDDCSLLKVVPLSGAMTNKVYQIKWSASHGDDVHTVLVRVYGAGVDIFFNREEEIQTFELMSKLERAPKLLGQFSGGRIEEFIHARTLTAIDLRDPQISSLIAAKMWEFHNLNVPVSKTVSLWDKLRKWVGEATRVCSTEDREEFCLDRIGAEISMLEKKLSCDNLAIGFCHNDLQYGNIMMDEKTRTIILVDYEYSSYNPIAYDIANHFCEMAANYHSETPHHLDYTKYPDLEERARFVHAYLSSKGASPPPKLEVEELVKEVEMYSLANHLYWGLWGIISGYVNKIDFNYLEYARQRFAQYWLKKHML